MVEMKQLGVMHHLITFMGLMYVNKDYHTCFYSDKYVKVGKEISGMVVGKVQYNNHLFHYITRL